MEGLYERIRVLRKDFLKMSQTDFGERLGVNRDVINNIENNRLARPEQKLSLIKLICKEFSVNESWLINGDGTMFVEPDSFSLNEFVKSHGATELELEFLKAYFELDPEIRRQVIEHFKSHLKSSMHPDTPEELEEKYPPVDNVDQAG